MTRLLAYLATVDLRPAMWLAVAATTVLLLGGSSLVD